MLLVTKAKAIRVGVGVKNNHEALMMRMERSVLCLTMAFIG